MTDRKTCQRWNEPGHAHALTFSCFRRRPFLSRDRSRQWMIDAIDRARTRHGFHLWAYVVMPEHVHVLICPTKAEYSISGILTTMEKSVSMRAMEFVEKHSPAFLSRWKTASPMERCSIAAGGVALSTPRGTTLRAVANRVGDDL